MTALAVDFGSFASDRRNLQNAADAIALAASQDLPDATAAQASANSWAAKNSVNPADMTVTITQQNLPSVPNPQVKVTIQRSHSFTFARLIGISSANVSASAVSIKTSPGGSAGLLPFTVQQSALNGVPPGVSVVIKYDANNPTTGNFGPIRLDGTGASVYLTTLENGSQNSLCASVATNCPYPSTVQTQTGNMIGPTSNGVDYRINNTSAACNTWSQVVLVNGSGQEGLNPACNPFGPGGNSASKQVIVIPVINHLCNGTCTVTVLQFALFFLEGYGPGGCTGNSCEIKGRFINSNTDFGALIGVFDPNSFAHFVRLTQ